MSRNVASSATSSRKCRRSLARPKNKPMASRTTKKPSWTRTSTTSAHDDGRAVGHDLGRSGRDVRCREAHVDHRIRAGGAGLFDHSVDGLAARLVEQRRVALELAADEILEPR